MHTPLLAGTYFTLACWLVAGAVVSLYVHFTGRRSVDFLLFSLMSIVVGVQSVGVGLTVHYADGTALPRWAAGATMAQAAAIIAAALHVQFALRFAGVKRQIPYTLISYGFAGALEYLVLRGDWMALDQAQTGQLRALGLDLVRTLAPLDALSVVFLTAVPLAHLVGCALFGRAYLGGRREGLAMFIGAGVFGLAAANDSLVTAGTIRGLYLLPVGLILYSLALGIAFVRRYALVRGEFGRQSKELSLRTRDLRRARRTLREVESELGRKEQLAAIGEMAAVIAHEVRNPLAVISNAVASLRREGLSRHDHDVLLTILDEETHRLNRLVSDLLSYARPIAVQRQRVVLHDLSQRATVVANHHDAKVIYDETSVRGQVWADANLLRQVFDNLVENAVQATGGTGTVTISVKPAVREGIDGFVVSVDDDGEGMDTQVRSRAKDPFFTTRPSGTGLGLAIVSRIVEAHGGDVSFQSRAGEGTTVSVFLPIGSESTPPRDPRRSMDTEPPLHHSDERPAFDKVAGD